jgi:hypothetical protein
VCCMFMGVDGCWCDVGEYVAMDCLLRLPKTMSELVLSSLLGCSLWWLRIQWFGRYVRRCCGGHPDRWLAQVVLAHFVLVVHCMTTTGDRGRACGRLAARHGSLDQPECDPQRPAGRGAGGGGECHRGRCRRTVQGRRGHGGSGHPSVRARCSIQSSAHCLHEHCAQLCTRACATIASASALAKHFGCWASLPTCSCLSCT